MCPDRHFVTDDLSRYEALLEMADLVVHESSLAELFPKIADRLRKVFAFEVVTFTLLDPTSKVMRTHFWERGHLQADLTELPVANSVTEHVWESQQPIILPDLQKETRFQQGIAPFKQRNLRSYCALPLTAAERRFGAIGFATAKVNAYNLGDLKLLGKVADLAALALENVITRGALQQERDRLESLLDVSAILMSKMEVQQFFPGVSRFVRKVTPHDFASLAFYDEKEALLRIRALESPLGFKIIGDELTLPLSRVAGDVLFGDQPRIFDHKELSALGSDFVKVLVEHGVRSFCSVPLGSRLSTLGALQLGSLRDQAFIPQDLGFLNHVASQIAAAMENAEAYREIAQLTKKLEKEKLYLEGEIRDSFNPEELVGESIELSRVLSQVKRVAPTDTSVLILGETGTGKELIARAIHRESMRKDASFIKLNCAAIPTGLLESELFGHEKGAFTGAVSQKVGRLELADHGTLFLDEVGDIPLELQPKLLRVLQDREFERLGGVKTVKVNVRLVAATNRDLAKRVMENEFRSDLFYRLNVFPIRLPTLRARKEDIPILVRFFVQKFANRMNKHIDTISTETMTALVNWPWPGNVRELENLIERSVLLSNDSTLNVPISELTQAEERMRGDSNLENLEREHILRVLRESGGVIAGANGAAARLGMKRTTLQSRMQKMGIVREEYQN
jgi:formate hydrogenlyase transcriptional activator